MTAGLFICDHVHPDYIDQYGDYSDMFRALFPEFDWVDYEVQKGIFPTHLDECDVYFATGSKHSVYEDISWIHQLKDWIAQIYHQQKYFVGFCFGHQLLGESLGGKVAKSPNGWCIGIHQFDVIDQPSWMVPKREVYNALMMCQDQLLVLPPDTRVLASNEMCPNAMVVVGKKMLGIQAHPEFSKEYDKLLIEMRRDKLGQALSAAGIESLNQELSTSELVQWIKNFLNPNF